MWHWSKARSAALVKLIPAWEPQVKPGNLDIDTWSETYGQPSAISSMSNR
jgi:hypothetical protein